MAIHVPDHETPTADLHHMAGLNRGAIWDGFDRLLVGFWSQVIGTLNGTGGHLISIDIVTSFRQPGGPIESKGGATSRGA